MACWYEVPLPQLIRQTVASSIVFVIAFLAAAPIIVWAGTPVCHCPSHEHADGEAAHRLPEFSPCGDETSPQSAFVWMSAPEGCKVVAAVTRAATLGALTRPPSLFPAPETPPPRRV